MPTQSDVHPREHVLSKLLELCGANAVHELAPRDHMLVLDVCALVDGLARAAAAAKTGVPSPATASTVSSGTGASSDGASTPSARSASPAPRGVFQSRLKQPTVFWRPAPRTPTSAKCGSLLAPSVRDQLETGAARTAVRPAAAATTKKNALRQPTAATRIPAAKQPVKTARKAQGAKPALVRATASIARPNVAQAAPISLLPLDSSPAATGGSKLRRPTIIVPHVRTQNRKNGARVVPSKIVPIDGNASKCIRAQGKAEQTISKAVQQLGEALSWRVRLEDSELFVDISKHGQAQVCATGDEIKAALMNVQFVVFEAVSLAQEAQCDVSAVWIDSRWLRARQENIEKDAAHVYDWVLDMTMAINDCLGVAASDQAFRIRNADVPVWDLRAHEDPVEVDVHAARAQKVKSSPTKNSVVRAEHAVGSFIVQLIGQWAASAQPENDAKAQYDMMHKLTADSRDLSALIERCSMAIEWCGNEVTPAVKEWDSILEKNYALAIQAIQQKTAVCSRLICKVDNRRDLAADDQLTLVSKEEQFPAEDYFTLDYYRETVLDIAHIHVRVTQGSEDPTSASYSKHAYALMAEVDGILDDIAVWADPRFAVETDWRSREKDAYLNLIFWCQQLHEEILEQCFFLSESISMRSYEEYEGEDDDEDEWLEEYDSGQDEDEEYLEEGGEVLNV